MKANILKFALIIGTSSFVSVAVQAAEQPPQYAHRVVRVTPTL